jgi:hypothetical protein
MHGRKSISRNLEIVPDTLKSLGIVILGVPLFSSFLYGKKRRRMNSFRFSPKRLPPPEKKPLRACPLDALRQDASAH